MVTAQKTVPPCQAPAGRPPPGLSGNPGPRFREATARARSPGLVPGRPIKPCGPWGQAEDGAVGTLGPPLSLSPN